MLITKHFVFVHIPKTGGSFLRRVCDEFLDPAWVVEHNIAKHGPDSAIPEPYRGLPRFATVRNPWDWYVSWYHYLKGSGFGDDHRERVRSNNPLWLKVSNNFQNDFKETIVNLLQRDIAEQGIHPRSLLAQARSEDICLLSVHIKNQISESLRSERVVVGKQESLREDFESFLRSHDIPVKAELFNALGNQRPANASERGPFQQYYDEELRDLIAHKSRRLIETYDYRF